VSADRFAALLQPGQIGSLTIRNRVLSCPMGHAFGDPDGTVSDNEAEFYEERARGGVGLLLMGTAQVAYPLATYDTRFPGVSHDRFLPGLTDLAARVHRHGGAIAAQLNHMGANAQNDIIEGRPLLVPCLPAQSVPDALMSQVTADESARMMMAWTQPTSKHEFKIADDEDIAWVIERFTDSTERVMRAGLDGVELHAGHGYLIDEFLSPHNQRDDGWGGPLENRARLLLEIIGSIRSRVGRSFPLWMRINAFEAHKTNGETFDEQLRVIELAVDAGIDAVHITAYHDAGASTGPVDSYCPHEVGPLADHAAAARKALPVPVITFGRFDPDEAEQVLRDGKADFVAVGRRLLADPELVNKLAQGRVDDVKPCIYNYRCIGNIYVHEAARCVVNPRLGVEHDNLIVPTDNPRRVLVIGAGPGGIEASVTLAQRGHIVSLWDSGTRLGGRLIDGASADPNLAAYLGWLARQVSNAAVDIRLGVTATVENVSAAGADLVVVATGADWSTPTLPGDASRVRGIADIRAWLASDQAGSPSDALARSGTVGGDSVVGATVVGDTVVLLGGGKAALSIARLCAARGRRVTIVESGSTFGTSLGVVGRFKLLSDLVDAGVTLLPDATIESIEPQSVRVNVGGEVRDIAASTVISTTATTRRTGLADELRATGIEVHEVGDCREVRFIEGATRDALSVAMAL
jgi:2,4-dienoyl-CoA reductase-like NADH-dependent reductase (Old Yellow Enzyme family)/thioredoxin reductase